MLGERLAFEVDRGVGEICRSGEAAGFKQVALPLLRRGVVDLEDAKLRVRVAVGEGVEACSEENVLCDALSDGVRERVFGVAAAGDEEGAEGDGERTVGTGGCAAKLFTIRFAKDGNGDWVVENKGGAS